MTPQRHIFLVRNMPWIFLGCILLSIGITSCLVAKKASTWEISVPIAFALIATCSGLVFIVLRPRCEGCSSRMKMRHEESLVHVCPKCGLLRQSDYVIPDSDMPS